MEWYGLWYWLGILVALVGGIWAIWSGVRQHRESSVQRHIPREELHPASSEAYEVRTEARNRRELRTRLGAQMHDIAGQLGSAQSDVAKFEVNYALLITAGRLVYQIPRLMWRGFPETVEVRLGRLEAQGIMDNFVGRGEVKTEEMSIVETMAVSLVAEPRIFDIEERSPRDQLVKPDVIKGTPLEQHDFAKWMWVVIPRKRGKHKLYVKISAALKDSSGLPAKSELPDKMFPVVVKVRVTRAVLGAVSRLTVGLAGAVATALVGAFTKDYWWPIIRDQWWPMILSALGLG